MSLLAKIVSAFLLVASCAQVQGTALDDYVWAPDDAYGWTDMGPEYVINGKIGKRTYTGYLLNMTSQTWLTDAEFTEDSQSHSLWWHYLVVIVPEEVKFTRNASMWITGWGQGSSAPTSQDEDIIMSAALALNTGTITGALFQIPNEHTTFSSDPLLKSRSEDAIIAYTWDHFLNDPSQTEWLLRFPMVKASLRAMDAITEFAAQKLPELNTQLDYYVVSGASKRGWTTWDVGVVAETAPTQALKERVTGIIPVVLDAINFVAVEHHEFRSYGGWSWALQDYVDMNLTVRFDDPNMVHLQEQVDPFFYFERLTMPKLVVNAGMDEFQQPDDTHYWWADMPEPKHFMMVPNAEHSLITGILEAVPSISAWAQALLYKDPVPKFTWDISEQTGAIYVTLDNMPNSIVHEATMWWAYSCGENAWDGNTKRKDFRIMSMDAPCNCGISLEGYCANLKSFWAKETLEMKMIDGRRTYTAQRDAPDDGRWVAFFIDIKFHNKHSHNQVTAELSGEDLAALQKGMRESAATRNPAKKSAGDIVRDYLTSQKGEEGDDDFEFGGIPKDIGGFFEFTSEVSVWPNTFPYEDCTGVDCGSRLV